MSVQYFIPKAYAKRRYKIGNYSDLNNFPGDTSWEIKFYSENIEKCPRRVCEVLSLRSEQTGINGRKWRQLEKRMM